MLTAAGPERARPEVSRRGQVLFEHAVYGEEGTNLRQLRGAADCLTLCAAANGCFTGALTDGRHRSKVRKGACVTNAPSACNGAELYER